MLRQWRAASVRISETALSSKASPVISSWWSGVKLCKCWARPFIHRRSKSPDLGPKSQLSHAPSWYGTSTSTAATSEGTAPMQKKNVHASMRSSSHGIQRQVACDLLAPKARGLGMSFAQHELEHRLSSLRSSMYKGCVQMKRLQVR